jgi:hypothetical protein
VTTPANGADAELLLRMASCFAFLSEDYGWVLATTGSGPAAVTYRSRHGSVSVIYDPLRDAAADVWLQDETSGETYRLRVLLDVSRHDSTRASEPASAGAGRLQLGRLAGLLIAHAEDFLLGDLGAFRLRHREALLVLSCRRLAEAEFACGDRLRAAALFDAFRAYWSESDHAKSVRCSAFYAAG